MKSNKVRFLKEKSKFGPIDRAATSAWTRTQIRMERLASHTSKGVGRSKGGVINKGSSVPSTSIEVVRVTEEEKMEM